MNAMRTADGRWIYHTVSFYGNQEKLGVFAIAFAVNELALRNAKTFGIDAQIIAPPGADRSALREMKKHMEKTAKEITVESFRAESKTSAAVRFPVAVVTAVGFDGSQGREDDPFLAGKGAGDIVFAGWAGLAGALCIAAEREEELSQRFNPMFIKQMKSYASHIFALREIAAAKAAGVSVIRQVSEGGILAALYRLAEETGRGICVDIKKISVKQEAIEVCEYYRINPYQLESGGSLLMLADDGEKTVDALRRLGIVASRIGRLTDSRDKVIQNGGEISYINRPSPDEIGKIFV